MTQLNRYGVRYRWRPKRSLLFVHESTEVRAPDAAAAQREVLAGLDERKRGTAEITRVFRIIPRPLTGRHARRPQGDGPEAA